LPQDGVERIHPRDIAARSIETGHRAKFDRIFARYEDLFAGLYMLGFNFLGGDRSSGEIAEIKGNMTIKLVHQLGEDLKFVVELPGEKQMTFSVDRSQIVTLAECWQ
jgi:hypothetical protein